jgi:uncharacterized membrane protein
MHQLDQFTYLTQLFWLLTFYISFYILLCYNGLPKISRILKLRKQLLSKTAIAENKNHLANADVVMTESFTISASYLSSSIWNASEWCKKMIRLLNEKELLLMNKSFLSSVASMSVSYVLQIFLIFSMIPSGKTIFVKKALSLEAFWLKVQRKIAPVKKKRKST